MSDYNSLYNPIDFSRSYSEGFFMSPHGYVFCNNGKKHINFIFTFPEIFNYKKDQIVSVYKKFSEPLGFEGKARAEIIRSMLTENWVHIRFFPKSGSWIFNATNKKVTIYNIKRFITVFIKWKFAISSDVFQINFIDTGMSIIIPVTRKD